MLSIHAPHSPSAMRHRAATMGHRETHDGVTINPALRCVFPRLSGAMLTFTVHTSIRKPYDLTGRVKRG